ncbi:MAG: uroporphyrinogen-III C-methyltransferase [Campylobacterota bacterium]|nr:uroporphyrinogen-III C-methyltransferase [Campylobacterota bacterium]
MEQVSKSKQKVYLIGAGPGDIELLTIKAVAILKEADVVLYDALVDESCFLFCKSYVLRVNVGKRKDKHSKRQEEINELLVKHAKSGKTVVRLKGGTPFVFGRGYEEVRALEEAGFDPVVIPGVSASTSVPESFMIPLIDRKFNDSYRTITGHDIKVFDEIVSSYHPRENLVIMMGVHNLKKIVDNLLSKDFPYDTPLAVLSKGTTLDASIMNSSIGEISEQNEKFFEELKDLTPAIIFIGETVNASGYIN